MNDEQYVRLLADIRRILREEFEAYRGNGEVMEINPMLDANVEEEIDLEEKYQDQDFMEYSPIVFITENTNTVVNGI